MHISPYKYLPSIWTEYEIANETNGSWDALNVLSNQGGSSLIQKKRINDGHLDH